MVDVYRVTATWQGFQGAPGYSKLSFMGLTDATKLNGAGAATRAFFASFVNYLKSGWTITVQPVVQVHEMATGELLREETMSTAPTVVSGVVSAGTTYTGGAGAYVTWNTGAVYNGHKVRGRTYLVPLVSVNDTDGTVVSAFLTTANTAVATFIAAQAGQLAVWSKTFSDPPDPHQIGGGLSTVTAGNVPDKSGILRSRRD